jgi:hypothetical protein
MPRDTCQSYMWVIGNFQQTGLQEIFVPHKNSWIILLSHMEKARRIPHLSNL